MEFLSAWWGSMDTFQHIMAFIAIPTTVILLLQTIMMLFGMGFGHDADTSMGHDGGIDAGGHDIDAGGHEIDMSAGHEMDVGHDIPAGHEVSVDHSPLGDHGPLDDHYAGDHTHESGGDNGVEGLRLLTVRGIIAFLAVGGWMGIAMTDLELPQPLPALIAFASGFASLLVVAIILKWSMSLQESGNMQIHGTIGKTAEVYTTIPPSMAGKGKVLVSFDQRFEELEAMTSDVAGFKARQIVKIINVLDGDVLLVESMAPVSGFDTPAEPDVPADTPGQEVIFEASEAPKEPVTSDTN